jgi:hypothetical protein
MRRRVPRVRFSWARQAVRQEADAQASGELRRWSRRGNVEQLPSISRTHVRREYARRDRHPPFLPIGLSPRNVLIPMTASTGQQVAEAGRWGCHLKWAATMVLSGRDFLLDAAPSSGRGA